MSAAAFVDRAQAYERLLVDKEAARSGQSSNAARRRVASKVGIAPGTLENLRRGRLKDVTAYIYAKLHASVIAELEAELRHVEHELAIARAAGLDVAAGGFLSLEANETRLKEALGLAPASINGGM